MTASGHSAFRPDIEGLRAVAIILVLLYHAQIPWFPGGFIGVDVFFVLSGFLITRSLLAEVEATGSVRLREFYARRVRRLLPASALVLVATGLGVWTLLPSSMWRTFGGDVVAAGAYVVNWRFALRSVDYLAQDVLPSPVQHFWSLSVEEQFYFIWPALIIGAVLLAKRLARPTRRMVGAVLLLVVLAPSLTWSIISSGQQPASAFFVTTTRLWELAVGALVAVVGAVALGRWPRLVIKTAALVTLVLVAILVDGSVPWPGVVALAPILATAALIFTGGHGDDLVERGLSLRPMTKVGAWSYSLYLWHWPPLAILAARWDGLTISQAMIITLLSTIPAVLAYRWVESPLRFMRPLQLSPGLTITLGSSLTLATVVVGLGIALSVPVAGAAPEDAENDSFDSVGARSLSRVVDAETLLEELEAAATFSPSPANALEDRPALYSEGCQVNQTDFEPVVCEGGDPDGGRLIVVMGDSKVAQWVPAFDRIGQRRGWRVLSITKSACEFSMSTPSISGEPYDSCTEWNQEVRNLIAELEPEFVLTSQGSSTAWTADESLSGGDRLVEGMLEAYGWVEEVGSETIIVLDNPYPPFVVRDCVAANPDDLATCVTALDEIDDTGARTVQRRVAMEGDHPVLDMTDLICPSGLCLPVIGEVLVYRDGSHITVSYVNSMVDAIEQRLIALMANS